MSIHFEKAKINHIDIIFNWLAEPFVQEFWDNTQCHKDDILNFVNGRTEPSNYCDGKYVYWIASWGGHPFAMLMSIQETEEDHIDDIKLNHLSKTGHTYGIDYMIGDKNYFGQGYGAKTLSEFLDFFRREIDVSADTFIIDPAIDNARAKHVYMKAGFEYIADFVMGGNCSGAGMAHHLLIKRFLPHVQLVPATLVDYPTIQNLWPFYVYDLSRECGFIKGWESPTDRSFVPDDLMPYFNSPNKTPFLIKVGDELGGFALINKLEVMPEIDFFLSEFFILAKFQNKGIGRIAATALFNQLKGKWGLGIIPENKKALAFWQETVAAYTAGSFSECLKTSEELKTAEHPDPHPMIIFTFDAL